VCAFDSRQFDPAFHPNGRHAAPKPEQVRAACFAIIRLAEAEKDVAVRRILAAEAFALAQQAQLQAWAGKSPKEPAA